MFRITHVLSVGPFATAERAEVLLANGVTHILNVSDSPSVVGSAFRESAWIPLKDYCRIPDETLVECLDTLHRMASEPDSHVYVHCIAGRQRSPTVLWLYLIALGLDEATARTVIESRSRDSIAGFPILVNAKSVNLARSHGLQSFLPVPRGGLIVPFSE